MDQDGNVPSPNFSQQDPSSGFLGFSSTPVADGRPFKPKWGKRNRQDNWNRFGQSQEESGSNYSGYSRGGGGGWRGGGVGGGGGWRGGGGGGGRGRWNGRGGGGGGWTPRGGGGYNNSWQGGQQDHQRNRNQQRRGGWQGNFSNNEGSEGYFHPAMLQDPWAELQQSQDYHQTGHWDEYQEEETVSDSLVGQEETLTDQKDSMSESLIVQVGDSLCERNDKILDTTDSTEAENRDETDNKIESHDEN